MKKNSKVLLWIVLCVCLCGTFAGCSQKRKNDNSKFYIYYLNVEETRIEKEAYTPKDGNTEEVIKDFYEALGKGADEKSYINLLPESVPIKSYKYQDNILVLDFDEAYKEMSKQREVLTRCGIVRTFCQIQGVDYVKFLIDGEELTKTDGFPIGIMNSETFVENSGKEINSYMNSKVNLYFSNKTGDKLVKEIKNVYYNTNVSLERVVVEQLLKGPTKEESKQTIPSDTKILGVTVADQVCYVNLDTTFSTQLLSVDEKVPIYSIVNSIMDTCYVNKVQISINGETNLVFRETMDLNQFFEKNQEIIQQEGTNE